MKGYIHSIESLGTVDGPGVRFVVFFQGCALRCLYCHNPDTWAHHGGTEYEAQQIIDKMVRNLPFYETGGITATGGEPLLQIDFLTELFKLAKERGIHTALDTSGITFDREHTEKFDILMEYCDLVMLDIKHMDEGEHIRLTGATNKHVFDFLSYLKEKNKGVWIRHVIVPGITYEEKELISLGKYLKGFDNVEKIDILPYHTLGVSKYESLGIDYPLKDTPQLTKTDALRALEIVNSAKYN
ncbi:MAG: pyruvate formate lyase-activating protein [Ruminococcaceae bacterium]|nr:pyruvate formate lyase-activating protein [Oscillospiraceae bacterium]